MPTSRDPCKQERMCVTTDERQNALSLMRARHHRTCPVCGENPNGLRAVFQVRPDGAVEAEVVCGEDKEGYAGHLHGGIIASLLDGAMTNCLFSHGVQAVTGELSIKLRLPIDANAAVIVRAWLQESLGPLYYMRSELQQKGRVAASGRAKFMKKTPTERTSEHRRGNGD